MPHKIINHLNTIIYKIVCKNPEITDSYVGKTTDFTRRKSKHKSDCNNLTGKYYEYNIYQFIRANGGWDNWDMIQIEKYEAVDMLDSKQRERFWIETLQAKLNKQIPSRTIQEYYQSNKDTILKKQQEYKLKNQDKLQEYQQEYKLKNQNKLQEYYQEYYQKNKDKFQKYQQEYRLKKKSN